MNRLDYIDFAKGLGIIMVVINHGLFKTLGVELFHMPLFFFITGLTFAPPNGINSVGIYVIKKANRILIPWIFFTIVSAALEIMIGKISPEAPFNGPLWFLQTLMVALIMYNIVCVNVSTKCRHYICFLAPIFAYVIHTQTGWTSILPFGFVRALEAMFFIHAGWCFRKLSSIKDISPCSLIILCTLLFSVSVYFSINRYDLTGCSFANAGTYTYNLPLGLLTMISGIGLTIGLSMMIKNISIINWMGRNSLIIMCVHFPILERLNTVCFYAYTHGVVTMPLKVGLAVVAYLVTFAFSALMVEVCKRYLPKYTGFENLIPI